MDFCIDKKLEYCYYLRKKEIDLPTLIMDLRIHLERIPLPKNYN